MAFDILDMVFAHLSRMELGTVTMVCRLCSTMAEDTLWRRRRIALQRAGGEAARERHIGNGA